MRIASLLLAGMLLAASCSFGQERRVYEGVVELKKETIGTVILLDVTGNSVGGWIRLEKFVPIEAGTISPELTEFRAAGNTYQIDERRGKISYSGPDGAASRLIRPLARLTGLLEEVAEASRFSGGYVAGVEVNGRRRDIRFREPSLWKRQGPPFEKFPRVEELLGREVSFWLAEMDERSGRLVVVEEPDGMDIPLKPPKKSQQPPKKQDDGKRSAR